MTGVWVDILDGLLSIGGNVSRLKPSQASQLAFWGFERAPNGDGYEFSESSSEVMLPKLLSYFEEEGVVFSLSERCQEYLSGIRATEEEFGNIRELGADYKRGAFDQAEFDEFRSFAADNIVRSLKEHQLKASHHLYLVRNGANFSVPGSGKTAAVLTVYEKLRQDGQANLLFVVGPASCFGPWRTEFNLTLGRAPKCKLLAGGDQHRRKSEYYCDAGARGDLYLTTFQTLANDENEVMSLFQQNGVDVYLVIDEAHYIKQLGGTWANAALKIARYAKFKCILTGTPLPRCYTDVFNQFDFLWPDCSPLDSNRKVQITLAQESHDETTAKDLLIESIGPFFYRVRKSDLGLRPAQFHASEVLSMNKYEQTVYEAIETKIRDYSKHDYLKNIDLVQRLIRGRIMRLRQSVSYVGLLSTAVEGYAEDLLGGESDLTRIIQDYDSLEVPAKLRRLKEMVGHFQQDNRKVVIWSNFIGTLKLICKTLTEEDYYCKLIYGETPTEKTSVAEENTRENIRDEFVDQESGLDILIANPAACAESISLHKTCFHAVYYDLSYNCAQYLQSLDRIHRVGGSEDQTANYHFLEYGNTIDQDIRANLEAKAARMNNIIEDDYAIYSLDMFAEDDDTGAYKRLFEQK